MKRKRILQCTVAATILLLIAVFLARTLELRGHSGRAFIRSSLLHDTICYVGSYEMIVCPYTTQPYETYMTILAILIVSTWAVLRKK